MKRNRKPIEEVLELCTKHNINCDLPQGEEGYTNLEYDKLYHKLRYNLYQLLKTYGENVVITTPTYEKWVVVKMKFDNLGEDLVISLKRGESTIKGIIDDFDELDFEGIERRRDNEKILPISWLMGSGIWIIPEILV